MIVPPAAPIVFVTGLPMGVPMAVMAAEVSLFPVELFPGILIPVKLVFTQLLISAAKSMMVKSRSIY
jgi:hypothetical protein